MEHKLQILANLTSQLHTEILIFESSPLSDVRNINLIKQLCSSIAQLDISQEEYEQIYKQ